MTVSLPEPMGPFLTIHLEGLYSIIRNMSQPPEAPPMGFPRTATITLTPAIASGAVLRHDNKGYFPEVIEWHIGPREELMYDWPFTGQVLNLSDPDIDTDADSYRVDVTIPAKSLPPSPNVTPQRITGVLVCPASPPAQGINLLDLLPLAAASPTSPIVVGQLDPDMVKSIVDAYLIANPPVGGGGGIPSETIVALESGTETPTTLPDGVLYFRYI